MNSDIRRCWLRGKIGEKIAKQDYKDHGFEVISMHKGGDFIAMKKVGNDTRKEIVEVKTGKSLLSKVQRKKKSEVKKQGIIYTEYRISTSFLNHYLEDKGENHDIL